MVGGFRLKHSFAVPFVFAFCVCLLFSGCGAKENETLCSAREQSIEDAITAIRVDWISGDIQILRSKDNYIRIVQSAPENFPKKKLFIYSIKDGVLTITDKNKTDLGFSTSTNLELYCPDKDFDSISINCTNGKIEGKGLHTKSIDVKSTSGDTNISGIFETMNLNNHNGDTKIFCNQMPKALTSTTTVGNVVLNLPQNDGFTLSFDSTVGNLKCDFALQQNGENHIYKNGSSKITADITNGDLTIHQIS
jgi:DUF4097 and DUF4098 domain-containing protein YvlB